MPVQVIYNMLPRMAIAGAATALLWFAPPRIVVGQYPAWQPAQAATSGPAPMGPYAQATGRPPANSPNAGAVPAPPSQSRYDATYRGSANSAPSATTNGERYAPALPSLDATPAIRPAAEARYPESSGELGPRYTPDPRYAPNPQAEPSQRYPGDRASEPKQDFSPTTSPPAPGVRPRYFGPAKPQHDRVTVEDPPAPPPKPARFAVPTSAEATPVASAPPETPVSPGMRAVQRQAQEHVQRGIELGTRRAYFSSRAEFIQALRIVTQALDVEAGGSVHSQALADGLRALDEADDLNPRDGRLEADLNVTIAASVHRTPVVRMVDDPVPPVVARQMYYSYGQSQLGEAVRGSGVGSAALQGIGKLYAIMARERSPQLLDAEPKAMTLQQAALLADSSNAVAANELAVLLARYGRFEEARAWLQHSVSLAPQPETWHNLAVVHGQLGEAQFAEQAQRQLAAAQQAKRNGTAAPGTLSRQNAPDVRWVSPAELARMNQSEVPAAKPEAGRSPPPGTVGTPSNQQPSNTQPANETVRLPRPVAGNR